MGGCLSISLSGDDLIRSFSSLCRQGYIQNLKQNLKDLEREMEDLKAAQDAVKNKLAVEERQPRQQMTEGVKLWLTRIEKTETEYNTLSEVRDEELQKLCLCDLGSKNVCASYKYGKIVFLLLEDVKRLNSVGIFEVVTEQTSKTVERPSGPMVGHEKMLDKAWNRLMEDGIGIMGLHGMGGVGKTTLLTKIHNKFTAYKDFNVIWVGVSQGATFSKIQDDIAQKLYICDEGWNKKNESDKAVEIHRVLKGKKFVLMLDDIWKEVDLEAIGVPLLTRENECKVAFTTRSRDVCVRMGDHEPMQVKCLEKQEAWNFFENMVGASKLRNDPVIEQLAREVAEKCGGLPLALIIIGKTMAPKDTVQEWEHAVYVLTRSPLEYPDIEKILSILKYSYDSLRDEHTKSCFLYCALFQGAQISKDELIEYWICEGFMGECPDIKRAINKGYEIFGTLIRANLLMVKSGGSRVLMHDVVREMALGIASDFFVQTQVELDEVPKLKDCGAVRRMSFIGNEIKALTGSSKFYELTTLLLRNNIFKNLSGEFIQFMQKLVVLDLSNNPCFKTLPEQISELVCLQFINLSYTGIQQLPTGFQELKKLINLDLTCTVCLCSIRGVSRLSSLRCLSLSESKVHGDIILSKELQHLKHLEILHITVSTELGLEQMLSNQRLAKCINGLHILRFEEKPFDISLIVSMENLQRLTLEDSHVSENITFMKYGESISPCFRNLFHVDIKSCSGITDLTWLLVAPNLVSLSIVESNEFEEMINKEKATNLTGITPFQKLEKLSLVNLYQLESIHWSPLPFPVIVFLSMIYCPKLRKLPLNASSAPQAEEFFIGLSSREQISDFEWEDEDTKNRFLPFTTDMSDYYESMNDGTIDPEFEEMVLKICSLLN